MLTYDGFLDPRTNASGDVTGYRVNPYAETLRIRYRVCPDVRFANQPVPGFCSATWSRPTSS